MKTRYKVISVSLVFGLLFWVIDTVLDYFFYYEGTLLALLITDVPAHEVYVRLIVMACFIVFGILVSGVMAKHQQAEARTEHLNLVLRAIRSVNQLIARERDRDRLLQDVCENLIETRGYHNAWIALLDEEGELVETAEAGLGEEFLLLLRQLRRGELTACGRRAARRALDAD